MTATSMPGARDRTDDPPIPIRKIGTADLKASLSEGYADFMSKRGDLIFVGLIYPIVGMLASAGSAGYFLYMLFPIAAGISLLGPLVATGFYELARRREAGLDARWRHFADVFRSPSRGEIASVGALLIGIFFLWLAAAGIIHTIFFGDARHDTFGPFLRDLFTTPQGWGLIIVGNLVGLCFAVVVLAISVVSLPMLVDRRVDAGTAVRTSLAAFRENRGVLLRWGLIIAALLVIGAIPLFVGLAVVLPILGYSSWHLYTRLIDRSALPPV